MGGISTVVGRCVNSWWYSAFRMWCGNLHLLEHSFVPALRFFVSIVGRKTIWTLAMTRESICPRSGVQIVCENHLGCKRAGYYAKILFCFLLGFQWKTCSCANHP